MPTVHATVVLVGARAVLIRGPSGAGKSGLALALIAHAGAGRPAFARLVADDRVELSAAGGRLMARVPPVLAGLIERRGEGIVSVPHEPVAVVGLVVDLDAEDGGRMPEPASLAAELCGVSLPRLPVARGADALGLVLARLASCTGW